MLSDTSSFMSHQPVMMQEVLSALTPTSFPADQSVVLVDMTFGRGGHACALLDHIPQSRVIAFDKDPQAIAFGHTTLGPIYGDRLTLVHESFSQIDRWVDPGSVAGILCDLGMSSPQLDQAERGFSLMHDGPLDMRMSCTGPTAADIVNQWSEKDLANVIYIYGQEHASRRIARAVVQARQRTPLTSTGQLRTIIEHCVPRRGKKHPATQTFQALRMMVNGELEDIHQALPKALACLSPKGSMAIISFHSLEDRMIKQFFKESHDSWEQYTKKPINPTLQEVRRNPRSRSACLRYGVRL